MNPASDPLVTLAGADLHQEEHVVLRDVNLEARPGEFLYLIGKTGSGKSSLLKTLYGELPLTSGSGSVCGIDLGSLSRKRVHLLRRKLGIVFQDFELLYDRTAEANLDFVLKVTEWKDAGRKAQRIEDVLTAVGLENKGYKRPHELSGGERQRLSIARALLNAPDLILADEPTGNLDPSTAEGILQLLHSLSKQGRCVIMATHDHHMVQRHPGRILMCAEGSMQEITALPAI